LKLEGYRDQVGGSQQCLVAKFGALGAKLRGISDKLEGSLGQAEAQYGRREIPDVKTSKWQQ
jgi:hypothetical protein